MSSIIDRRRQLDRRTSVCPSVRPMKKSGELSADPEPGMSSADDLISSVY